MFKFRPFLFPALGLFLVAVVYIMTFPTAVQSGDTGELVTNSYFLRVLHPPGYPLFTLIYHNFLNAFSFSTVFGRASILTILISFSWMSLLLFRFRSFTSLLVILVTATSLLFWRYAVLPDVFSMHLFFITLVFLAFDNPKLLEKVWFLFLLGLSVAHHHTIVFAFPLFVFAFFHSNMKKVFLLSVASGAIGFLCYLLMMKFHPDHLLAWGKIDSVSQVVNHFLRKEYGTFSLSVWKNAGYSWVSFGTEILLKNYWSLLCLLGYSIHQNRRVEKKNWLILACAFLYLLTFLVSGSISLNLSGQGVFERFLLQPLLFLVFFVLVNLPDKKIPPALIVFLAVNICSNVFFEWDGNDFSQKTQTEDHAINILNSLPERSIYSPQGDTESFGAYYVKEILGVRPDVILTPSVGVLSWSEEKLRDKYPEAFSGTGPHPLEKVNLREYHYFSNNLFPVVPGNVAVTRYGLVYHYQNHVNGSDVSQYNCSVTSKYVWRNIPELSMLKSFDYGHHLYLSAGGCHYSEGVEALRSGELSKAKEIFTKGVSLFPLNVPLLDGKCRTSDEQNKHECTNELELLIEKENQQYYLYKF